MEICKYCGRIYGDHAPCLECPPPTREEHRGSRPFDADFRAAAATGFEPLTEDAKVAFREKAEIFRKVIGGRG